MSGPRKDVLKVLVEATSQNGFVQFINTALADQTELFSDR